MSLKKRVRDSSQSSGPSNKKPKIAKEKVDSTEDGKPTSKMSLVNARTDEIDFPRGGGTTLNPMEYKMLRDEARREVDEELFMVSSPGSCWTISNDALGFPQDPSSSKAIDTAPSQNDGNGKLKKRKKKKESIAMDVDHPAIPPHKLSHHV